MPSTSYRTASATAPEADTDVEVTVPVIAVVADQVLTPDGPDDIGAWARGSLMFWEVADGLDLNVRLRHAHDVGRPAPLLLGYGKGSQVVRFAAPILGLTRVLPPRWTFVCEDVREDLIGRVVQMIDDSDEPAAISVNQGITYHSPQGPGRDSFVRALLRS